MLDKVQPFEHMHNWGLYTTEQHLDLIFPTHLHYLDKLIDRTVVDVGNTPDREDDPLHRMGDHDLDLFGKQFLRTEKERTIDIDHLGLACGVDQLVGDIVDLNGYLVAVDYKHDHGEGNAQHDCSGEVKYHNGYHGKEKLGN